MKQLQKDLAKWRNKLLEAIDREKALMAPMLKEWEEVKLHAYPIQRLASMGKRLQKVWKDQETAVAKINKIRKQIEELLKREIEI